MWLLLLMSFAFADRSPSQDESGEFEGLARELSIKYFAGSYLIYDCIDKHFVCADEYEYKRCEDRRSQEEKDMKIRLACVPVKKYADRKECEVAQKEIVSQGRFVNFCLHEDFKKRLIR